ncbi:hypothetical protein BK147_23145 [Paenibacillus sp. FSL R7-0337]|nr:hypothetical protein BK147_23145 [Paenibacillus sp. FSL R7-0337]
MQNYRALKNAHYKLYPNGWAGNVRASFVRDDADLAGGMRKDEILHELQHSLNNPIIQEVKIAKYATLPVWVANSIIFKILRVRVSAPLYSPAQMR